MRTQRKQRQEKCVMTWRDTGGGCGQFTTSKVGARRLVLLLDVHKRTNEGYFELTELLSDHPCSGAVARHLLRHDLEAWRTYAFKLLALASDSEPVVIGMEWGVPTTIRHTTIEPKFTLGVKGAQR